MLLPQDDVQRIMHLIEEYILYYRAALYGVSSLSTQAYTALQTYPPHVVLEVADSMTRHPDPEQRFLGARMILSMDVHTYLPRVLHLLTDDDDDVRGSCAMIVGSYKDPRAVPTLRTVLQHDVVDNNRVLAAEALGDIGDARALPALQAAMEHDMGVGWENRTV